MAQVHAHVKGPQLLAVLSLVLSLLRAEYLVRVQAVHRCRGVPSNVGAEIVYVVEHAAAQAAAAGGLAASHPAPIERNFDPPTTPKICINAVG